VSEPVHLYFDAACGPCTLFAQVARALGTGRVRLLPLGGTEAERELAEMGQQERDQAFHLVGAGHVQTGEAAVIPLVGLTFGERAERVARAVPPLRWGLVGTYRRFWRQRQLRGCATPAR
jgi:predicted DCC family thiol-disulfide oxidoreductase YuxK